MALKAEHGGCPWFEWEKPLRFREQTALDAAKKRLHDDINFYMFVQFLAFSQWHDLKTYSRDKNVLITGDMPIYVSLDSSDTWANHALFQLDEKRQPLRVAGCPPDPFAAGGQLWGNPLYDWDALKADGFGWWILRLKESLELFDVVRIDHFRGLEGYFSIPAGDQDARGGEWIKGPGTAFIDALHAALPHARIIAEDLGYVTEDVAALLRHSGYPGMKVLQFAFDSREKSDYMPYAYPHNCVVYTGTHDNPTAKAWFETAQEEDIELAAAYLGIDSIEKGPDMLIRCALSSVAGLCVIPLQDYLGLGAEARMNAPSISGGNWRWRVDRNALTDELSRRIHALTAIYGRSAVTKQTGA
jgi:4-alpha-glucanotransferase